MKNPIEVIEKINDCINDVLLEENITYLGEKSEDILNIYSADFCGLMLKFFPGATIMMHKNFRKCAILIRGVVYDSYGICDRRNYFIANQEEINFIQKSFKQISNDLLWRLTEKIFDEKDDMDIVYSLRKNNDYLT